MLLMVCFLNHISDAAQNSKSAKLDQALQHNMDYTCLAIEIHLKNRIDNFRKRLNLLQVTSNLSDGTIEANVHNYKDYPCTLLVLTKQINKLFYYL